MGSILFGQDDYKIRKSLNISIGLRYEHLGHFGDQLDRNSSFDISKADPNPPPSGSLAGYVVSATFPDPVPQGVEKTNNTFANRGVGQNAIAPRVGFAWRVPNINRFVLRGAYGISRGQPARHSSKTRMAHRSPSFDPISAPQIRVPPSNRRFLSHSQRIKVSLYFLPTLLQHPSASLLPRPVFVQE